MQGASSSPVILMSHPVTPLFMVARILLLASRRDLSPVVMLENGYPWIDCLVETVQHLLINSGAASSTSANGVDIESILIFAAQRGTVASFGTRCASHLDQGDDGR